MFRAYDTGRSIMAVQSNVVFVSEKQKQLKVFGYEYGDRQTSLMLKEPESSKA
jgi:hypothetical protein